MGKVLLVVVVLAGAGKALMLAAALGVVAHAADKALTGKDN